MDDCSALVLSSGGQNSATCLAWALDRSEHVETIGFDYSQRHRIELDVRPHVLNAFRRSFPTRASKLGDNHVIDIPVLARVSETALTSGVKIAMHANGLRSTFVPGRNLLFLILAAAAAYWRGGKHLITGVCETDYSGYPDHRDKTMKAMKIALNLGMKTRFLIHTPLMWIDKAETWRLIRRLGGEALVDIVREKTHTCYNGDRAHGHEWGYGCGTCPACDLRADGWMRFRSATAVSTHA